MTSFKSPHLRRKADAYAPIELAHAVSVITGMIKAATPDELQTLLAIQNDLLRLALTRIREKDRN